MTSTIRQALGMMAAPHAFARRHVLGIAITPLARFEGFDAWTFDDHLCHIFTHGVPPSIEKSERGKPV
jgi:hypothetical protein